MFQFPTERVGRGAFGYVLQHHSSKASILQCSAFFIVQLSPPYMTTGKTIALTRRTFVGKIMSLLFNILSWLVGSVSFPTFFFKTGFAIPGPFHFHINLIWSIKKKKKKPFRVLIGTSLNLYVKIDIFIIWTLMIHEHCVSLHLLARLSFPLSNAF